jgi:hypothetical protein
MTTVKLRELHNARPFHPFIIHLADGRTVSVTHPEVMAVSPSGRTVHVVHKDDSFNIIDLLLVTDLEVKSNGKSARGQRR